ncbi:hypothetical protein MTX78_24050 (plasmid) [Hymenobacter tibetensis]|uniref:AraC family transcriptional regulator n=1 Tax=Hymenobacter tibetensis TaxID=497967 RepID=A0ABY4D7E0_9BACT|nr:hypothetical protein [Hymenobacter tibetensis]UOG77505.1 hypothetical protein MTX78_24050 [Hymenobacter tibetensis]
MPTYETISDYYRRYGHGQPANQQVAAYRIDGPDVPSFFPHIRRDFYKIKLLCDAQGLLSYADQRVLVQTDALVFVNPLLPHSWARTAGRETGFACLFTEEFVT